MRAIATTAGAEIERLHALATTHADKAVDYAKQAGKLLLDVKQSLKHGEWLPWLEKSVSVSARQAQNYMAAANGKPLLARKIAKSKEPNAKSVSYLPSEGIGALAVLEQEGDLPDFVCVDWHCNQSGYDYFHITSLIGNCVTSTKRGVRSDFVDHVIFSELPGRYTRNGVVGLPWEYVEANPFSLVADCLRRTPDEEGMP